MPRALVSKSLLLGGGCPRLPWRRGRSPPAQGGIQILGGRLLRIMILEVPQLQVIDRLRDYSNCASDAMGLRLSLRGSGVRVHCRARWCADTSLWGCDCTLDLRGSGARVSVLGFADMGQFVLSLSVVLVLVCLCADTPIWARIAFSLSLFSGGGVHRRLRLRRCGQGLRSRSLWFDAGVHRRLRSRRRGQGLRSRSPWFGARVHYCRGAETAPLVCLFS